MDWHLTLQQEQDARQGGQGCGGPHPSLALVRWQADLKWCQEPSERDAAVALVHARLDGTGDIAGQPDGTRCGPNFMRFYILKPSREAATADTQC